MAGLEHLDSVFTDGIQKMDEISLDNSKLRNLVNDTISDFNIYNGPTNEFTITDLTNLTPQDLIEQGTNGTLPSNLNIGNSLLPSFEYEQSPIPSFSLSNIQDTFDTQQSNWSNLYTNDHTNKTNTGYHYSSYVNRDKLSIMDGENPTTIQSTTLSRASNFSGGGEPYIISNLSRSDSDGDSGRNINFGSKEFPITRATTDMERIGKFLGTPAGLGFIARQEVLGNQGITIVRNKHDKLVTKRQYKAFYNPLTPLYSCVLDCNSLGHLHKRIPRRIPRL